MRKQPHHLNVVGDFFVESDCCTHCGVPESEAPELFGDDRESCFVKKQPSTSQETERMLNAIRVQELGCIRYKGCDPHLLTRLSEIDEGAHIATADVDSPAGIAPRAAGFLEFLQRTLRSLRTRK